MVKGQKEVSEKVKEISEGVVANAVDLMLVSIYYSFEFAIAGYGYGWKAGYKAQDTRAGVNYKTLRRAHAHLRQKGLVQYVKEKNVLPKITREGKKRLFSLMPRYDKKRVWNGRIYLVTYDLPVANNKDRNLLREFLKRIGCGMLQHSVWITPYNPIKLIEEFVMEKDLDKELILVSSLGKDGTIGGMELSELVEQVYKLSELNYRYIEFMESVRRGKMPKDQIIFTYFSILKDDPQLPFKLLPEDWVGDEAYKLAMHVHA